MQLLVMFMLSDTRANATEICRTYNKNVCMSADPRHKGSISRQNWTYCILVKQMSDTAL